jgi:hypothetical protein
MVGHEAPLRSIWGWSRRRLRELDIPSSHRIKYLEALLDLDYVICHDGVALMNASEIGDWYRAEMSKVRNSKD